jgi:hypothetical protein
LAVYIADQDGIPLRLRQASHAMRVEDVRTRRRYIQIAAENNLVKIQYRSPDDRRKNMLQATETLRVLMKKELEEIAEELLQKA